MGNDYIKVVLFVPADATESVLKAIGDTGGGKLGNYSHCSFTVHGKSRFMPLKGSDPYIGEINVMQEVKEDRIEFVCQRGIAKKVFSAIRAVHPYNEVFFDIYPLLSEKELV